MVDISDFLEIKNLSLSINGRAIIDGISLSVKRGEFLAVIGPNGAGKSSLLKCAGCFYRHFSGDVMLEGKPLKSMREREIAKRIAWLHQTGYDSLPFTVREFAMMSRYPWRSGLGVDPESGEIVERAIATAGVADISERRLDSLSGGERQRALIAAALAQGTDILFLDEPTSFLDYRHQAEMLELIERINRERKVTILLVTHDINLALHGADRIAALKDGAVAWVGESSELLAEDALSDIFEIPFEKFRRDDGSTPYVAPRWRISGRAG